VVVEEVQDFGPAELKLLRALCPNAENDLFLCADAGQRIYRGRCSWASLGIDIRAKSVRLKLNYRTTETIRCFADRLLPAAVEGGDEVEAEKRDFVSLLQGPEPIVAGCTPHAEEAHGLAAWMIDLVKEGFRPNEIAIFGRTDAMVNEIAGTAVKRAGLAGHKLADDETQSGEAVLPRNHAWGQGPGVLGCAVCSLLPGPRTFVSYTDAPSMFFSQPDYRAKNAKDLSS